MASTHRILPTNAPTERYAGNSELCFSPQMGSGRGLGKSQDGSLSGKGSQQISEEDIKLLSQATRDSSNDHLEIQDLFHSGGTVGSQALDQTFQEHYLDFC